MQVIGRLDAGGYGLFMAVICACSGQPAPAIDKPVVAITPTIYITPDAAIPTVLGAACDGAHPCGPGLACEVAPGGTCSMACTAAGTPCGDGGTCVEYPFADVCRPSCTTTADCRADEGYACDPVWKGCVLANAPTIAPRHCPQPPGFGRDPAFAPPAAIASGRELAAALTDDGVVIASSGAVVRVDHAGPSAPTSVPAGDPALAREGSTLWLVAGTASQVTLIASRDRGRTWAAPVTIADRECGPGNCAAPTVAAGADAQRRRILYVAYPSEQGLRVRASRDGGASFGAPVTAVPGTRGSLTVAADGTLHVVALHGSSRGSYGAGDHEILLASSVDGGRSFSRPQRISRTGERLPFYFGTPRIEVDSARKWLYVAYTRGGRDGAWDLALAATKDKGKTWTRARIGDDAACAGTYLAPQLALDPTSGALHVAWYDSHGPRYAHGVCTDGLRACRQLGRLDDGAFAGLSLARHGATAAAEATALVVDNPRRLLHAVWAQPVGSPSGPEPRIFHAKAKLPLR